MGFRKRGRREEKEKEKEKGKGKKGGFGLVGKKKGMGDMRNIM